MSDNRLWGSDVIAQAIREEGFPYILVNPGASFRGLHDSLVNYLGNERPRMLVCLHEEHCISIGHGYAAVTDRPLSAVVHSNVGLMHATMAIFNAWAGRQPVVVFGATGPVDAAIRRPWIDWIHTSADQGALVRDYTKWDDQPASPAAAVESIRRASRIATTRPAGPVYVNFDATIQEMEVTGMPSLHDGTHYAAPSAPDPSAADLAQLADWLNGAGKVVIFAGRMGRDEAAWADRIALAEALGAHVVTGYTPGAFPTTHPCFAGETQPFIRPEVRDLARSADLILSLDWMDFGGILGKVFEPGEARPKIVHCSVDHHLHRGWNMDYHMLPMCDLYIAATAERVTSALLPLVSKRAGALAGRASVYALPPMPDGAGEIGIQDLAATFLNVTANENVSLLGRPIGWPLNTTTVEHPLDWTGETHGGGVGAGPGIAVGGALALRDAGGDRLPVYVCGDGDFLMGAGALWTAAQEKVPLLLIVSNNASYFNDELHQVAVARTRDRDPSRAWIGQRIDDPLPDIPQIARGHGAEAPAPVTDLADLAGAIRDAMARVQAGALVVLDVHVRREYADTVVTGPRK